MPTQLVWSSHTRLFTTTLHGAIETLGCTLCAPVTFPLIFRSSQGCMAVSIDTCTALVRFIGYFWRQTPAWVGLPPGFHKPTTHTNENPCPWTRVWVLMGTGAGYSGKPQGSPWHSLRTAYIMVDKFQVNHTHKRLNLWVSKASWMHTCSCHKGFILTSSAHSLIIPQFLVLFISAHTNSSSHPSQFPKWNSTLSKIYIIYLRFTTCLNCIPTRLPVNMSPGSWWSTSTRLLPFTSNNLPPT